MGVKKFMREAKPFLLDFWFVWKYMIIPSLVVALFWFPVMWFGLVTGPYLGIIGSCLPTIPVIIFVWKIRQEMEKRREEAGHERGWHEPEHRSLPSETAG